MKDFTLGTLIACLALSFTIGFLTCHKIYSENPNGVLRIKK
jgi:hypothetical protein